MKNIGFLALLLLVISCTSEPKKEAEAIDEVPISKYDKVKTGRFMYRVKDTTLYLVNRTAKQQIEYIPSKDVEVIFDVNWLSDSTYELAFDTISKNPYNVEFPNGVDSLVKTCLITRLTDSTYVELANSNLNASIHTTRYLFKPQ